MLARTLNFVCFELSFICDSVVAPGRMERLRIDKLSDEASWPVWKRTVKLWLESENLWDAIVNDGEIEKLQDTKAKLYIVSTLAPKYVNLTTNCQTAKEIWEKLSSIFEQSSHERLDRLMEEFFSFSMSKTDTIADHVANLENLFTDLNNSMEKLYKSQLHEAILIGRILSTLPAAFASFRSVWGVVPPEKRSLNLLVEKLTILERQSTKDDEDAVALRVNNVPECFHCGKLGHKKRDCVKWKKQKKSEKKKATPVNSAEQRDSAKVAESASGSSSRTTLYAESRGNDGDAYAATFSCTNHDWILDSGATLHLTGSRKGMSNFVKKDNTTIQVANGEILNSKGCGDVSVELTTGTVTIEDVTYVPEVPHNLLSVKKIADKGYTIVFDSNGGRIYDKCHVSGNVVHVAEIRNGLYKLIGHNTDESVNLTASAVSQSLWHRRLGHLNHRAMQQLNNELITPIAKSDKFDPCISCIEAKISRKPFPKKSLHKSTEILALIHTDLCGPMSVESFSGKRYFLGFTDDFSGMTFAYFVRYKSEVSDRLKEFTLLMERQTGHKIKAFRSDNGTEFVNAETKKFFADHGIRHEKTVPYSPQQNGIAERCNRTVIEKARAMLVDSGLDKRFWAEAVNTAVKNRSPSSSLGGRTPLGLWTNSKIDVQHLRLFGCTAYDLVEKHDRTKLDSKARKFVFVGYCEESKGYRLIDLDNPKKVHIARNVVFLEDSQKSNPDEAKVPMTTEDDGDNGAFADLPIFRKGTEPSVVTESFPTHSADSQDQVDVRRSSRVRLPKQFPGFVTYFANCCEPTTVAEALGSDDAIHWQEAMQHEYDSLKSNKTWDLVTLPPGKSAISCKWVFKRKCDDSGNTLRYRARLVARGFLQQPGRDYEETFAPVVKWTTLRLLMAIAARKGFQVDHLDVTTAFLYGDLQEEVYMKQPEGLVDSMHADKVCRLKKALYGLKQSARSWYTKISTTLLTLGFESLKSEPCVFRSVSTEGEVYIALYVDDLYIFSSSSARTQMLKQELEKRFVMRDLGEVQSLLNVRVRKTADGFSLDQCHYIERLLAKYGMSDCNPVATPLPVNLKLDKAEKDSCSPGNLYQELIGCLTYLATSSRPDIAYSVSYLAQFNNCHNENHLVYAKRILRYLKGTKDYALLYKKSGEGLEAYVDADWGSNNTDRRSYTGFLFKFASGPISWASTKQKTVALSSAEAEYMGLTESCKEGIFIKNILNELGQTIPYVRIFNDSQAAQKIAENDLTNNRTKHIDIRHHFIRDLVESKQISLTYLRSDEMLADVLTKALGKIKHNFCIREMGICSP